MEPVSTRERLIRAAEQLFAERGIDAVSLREINLAAGQRNTSASHYHFGSKDALIEAIFDMRQASLGKRRTELLSELLEREPSPPLRALMVVMVQPLQELVEVQDGACYIAFLAQLFIQPPDNWPALLARQDGGVPAVALEMNKQLKLPALLLRHRIAMAAQQMVTAMSSHARLSSALSIPGLAPLSFKAFNLALVDGMTAYMAAPVSPELLAELDKPEVIPQKSGGGLKLADVDAG